MKFKSCVAFGMISTMFIAAGCTDLHSGDVYEGNQTGVVQNVSFGTITSVRQVTIQDDSSNAPVGALAGAVVGGVLGNAIGHGTGRSIATVGGAVAGGLAGNAIQNQTGKTKGMEVEIRMDNGQTISIVQTYDPKFQAGLRVRLTQTGGRAKASLANTYSGGYSNGAVTTGSALQ